MDLMYRGPRSGLRLEFLSLHEQGRDVLVWSCPIMVWTVAAIVL
jgi:hypothetical protein